MMFSWADHSMCQQRALSGTLQMKIRQLLYKILTQAGALQSLQCLGLVKCKSVHTHIMTNIADYPTHGRVFRGRRLDHKPSLPNSPTTFVCGAPPI